jgi:hypothetical protein
MDDVQGSNDELIWNIYYHLFVNDRSGELLNAQAKKLHSLSISMRSWHDSQYGRFLRFCDQGTLIRVRDIWNSYLTRDLSNDEKASYDKRFKSGIRKAMDMQATYLGPGHFLVLTGVRSAAPASMESLNDLPSLFEHFWECGSTDRDRERLSRANSPNPTFASLVTDTFTLHYGTDPILGFHLAAAYAPLTSESPLNPRALGRSDLHKVVEAARLQFQAWGIALKRRAGNSLTLRFFCGDALALCHTLQRARAVRGSNMANWYRAPYHLEPLVVDSEDYTVTGDAPLSFNVIETSNLMDHVGAINLLVAASPLLDSDAISTMYTESLVRREENIKALLDSLLCGHFATMSIVFRLFPIEYWTNATAISAVDEGMIDATTRGIGLSENHKGQMHCRLVWKRPISATKSNASIRWNEADLALTLYQVYLKMFRHEDAQQLFSNLDLLNLQNHSNPHYHRGSLAALLRFVKDRVDLDWEEVMKTFFDLVENDSTILMGRNYIQEFYLHLHIFDVHSVPTFQLSFNRTRDSQSSKGLCAWNDLPPVVCITLKIPRAKLSVFTKLPPAELGTPIVHCILQSSRASTSTPWQNIFGVVQLAFGKVMTSGSRDSDNFKLDIVEDVHGWMGSSALLASFCVPTWVVLLDPENTTVAFGVQSTPYSSRTFLKVLGFEMNVYETNIGDESNVYITKHRPNQSGHVLVCECPDPAMKSPDQPSAASRTTITMNVNTQDARMEALTGRVSFFSNDLKTALRDGATVETIQISPCAIEVNIGKKGHRYRLEFPAPVLGSRNKTRIARKSSYVEVMAPIADPASGNGLPDFMYPLVVEGRDIVNLNMPRLNPDRLPVLDIGKLKDLQWLITHTSLMFSTRERTMRERKVEHQDVRLNFKDSLFSMFMHFSGLQGRKSHIFGINHPTGGGVHVLVFVSCLRLDLANHTVVLDVAILPLTDRLVPRIRKLLAALSAVGICNIKVDDPELRLWKQVIPTWVERCRQWNHRSSCEYYRSQIPLSIEKGQTPICSCGAGSLPARYISDVPEWGTASKHAVRAAISPSFSVPYVEHIFGTDISKGPELPKGDQCAVCGRDKSKDNTKLLRCGRCHNVQYCSVECQRGDWKTHKRACTKR